MLPDSTLKGKYSTFSRPIWELAAPHGSKATWRPLCLWVMCDKFLPCTVRQPMMLTQSSTTGENGGSLRPAATEGKLLQGPRRRRPIPTPTTEAVLSFKLRVTTDSNDQHWSNNWHLKLPFNTQRRCNWPYSSKETRSKLLFQDMLHILQLLSQSISICMVKSNFWLLLYYMFASRNVRK